MRMNATTPHGDTSSLGVLPLASRLAGWWLARFSTIHRNMLRVAHRAPSVLGESTPLVREFLRSRINPDGGFQGRTAESDLYYTTFGIDCLLALGESVDLPTLREYVAGFGDGNGLSLVHLCCLARARASLGLGKSRDSGSIALHRRIETHRAADGGYHPIPSQPHGTAYAAFLAFGACQDLRVPLPRPRALLDSFNHLQTPDGVWANERAVPSGSTNSSAAALAVLIGLRARVDRRRVVEWLLAAAHPMGGFRASPATPIPDLLSTATALHTLLALGVRLDTVREPCLDFIDSLWSNAGSFHAHWHEDILDVEYTFYGLLALGCLGLVMAQTSSRSRRGTGRTDRSNRT